MTSVLLTYGNAQLTLQKLEHVCFELMKKPQLLCCLLVCKAWCTLQILLHGLWNVCVLSWCKGPQHPCCLFYVEGLMHYSNTGMACEMCMFWVNVRDPASVLLFTCVHVARWTLQTGMWNIYIIRKWATYSFCVVYLCVNTVMLNALFKHWNGLWNIAHFELLHMLS